MAYILEKFVEIGLPEIVILLVFSQYIPHVMKGEKPIVDRFAVLFLVTIVWIYAHLLTVGGAYKNVPLTTQDTCRTDRAGIISGAPWIRIPYPFQWGAPTFDDGEAFATMAASSVTLIEVCKCNSIATFSSESWCQLAGPLSLALSLSVLCLSHSSFVWVLLSSKFKWP